MEPELCGLELELLLLGELELVPLLLLGELNELEPSLLLELVPPGEVAPPVDDPAPGEVPK